MSDERDDFWDLSDLTPKKHGARGRMPQYKDTDSAEVTFGEGTEREKYIIPRKKTPYGNEKHSELLFEYEPQDSLILKVKVMKWPSEYSFYDRFLQDARKYYRVKCSESPFVPFFSYLPQYNQMNIDQLRFYLYWRSEFSHGRYLKTDYSYIFLYLYELINLDDESTPEKRLSAMCAVLKAYREQFRSLDRYLGEWICDFCLIHRLPPPADLPEEIVSEIMTVVTLREFYIKSRQNIKDTAMRDLILRNNTYRYESSAAYSDETKNIFDKHLIRSVIYALEKSEHIKDGEPTLEKTVVSRTAYNGALCVSGTKCRIDAEYLSLNRSYRFRGMITGLVKCAENNIRAALGIKSRLSEAGLSSDAAAAMKEYYAINLPPRTAKNREAKKPDDTVRYELYDAIDRGFDPETAAALEERSWDLTKRLVAVDDEAAYVDEVNDDGAPSDDSAGQNAADAYEVMDDISGESAPYELLCSSMPPQMLGFLRILTFEGAAEADAFCSENGLLADAVISDINELAYAYTGDIIIENGELTEDYREEVTGALNKIHGR